MAARQPKCRPVTNHPRDVARGHSSQSRHWQFYSGLSPGEEAQHSHTRVVHGLAGENFCSSFYHLLSDLLHFIPELCGAFAATSHWGKRFTILRREMITALRFLFGEPSLQSILCFDTRVYSAVHRLSWSAIVCTLTRLAHMGWSGGGFLFWGLHYEILTAGTWRFRFTLFLLYIRITACPLFLLISFPDQGFNRRLGYLDFSPHGVMLALLSRLGTYRGN